MRMADVQLRDEALRMLDDRGAVLDAARLVCRLIRTAGIDAGLIGGLAVYAHGHRQATARVTVCVQRMDADRVADLLVTHGSVASDDPNPASLILDGVPVDLDDLEDVRDPTRSWSDINGLRVMSLPAFVDLQLRRAGRNVAHVGGRGDVVALIWANRLPLAFAGQLSRGVRNDFRRLVRAVRSERDRPPPAETFSHSG